MRYDREMIHRSLVETSNSLDEKSWRKSSARNALTVISSILKTPESRSIYLRCSITALEGSRVLVEGE